MTWELKQRYHLGRMAWCVENGPMVIDCGPVRPANGVKGQAEINESLARIVARLLNVEAGEAVQS